MIHSKSVRSIATSFLAAATLSVMLLPTAANASIFSHKKNTNASLDGKAQTVRFSLRNDSGADVELRAGDQVMTVAKGKTMNLNLAVGTRILANTASPKHEAGSIICEVSTTLANNTVVVN